MVDASTGDRQYYHTDAQGSVVAMTDDTGTIVEQYAYDPYGQSPATQAATGNPYRYTGRRLDPETGLYYYRARYYHPALGRFLQTDPIGYGDGMNLYAYVGNDPVNFVDPTGLIASTVGSALKSFGAAAMGFGKAALQLGYDTFVANDSGPYPTGIGVLWGAKPGPIFDEPATSAEAAGTAAFGVAAIFAPGPKGRSANNAVKQSAKLYHRFGDSAEAVAEIVKSGKLKGNPPTNFFQSDIPKVQAHNGPLPDGQKGIEFTTDVAPDKGTPPWASYWSGNGHNPGVDTIDGQAVISCTVTKINC